MNAMKSFEEFRKGVLHLNEDELTEEYEQYCKHFEKYGPDLGNCAVCNKEVSNEDYAGCAELERKIQAFKRPETCDWYNYFTSGTIYISFILCDDCFSDFEKHIFKRRTECCTTCKEPLVEMLYDISTLSCEYCNQFVEFPFITCLNRECDYDACMKCFNEHHEHSNKI